MFDFLANNPLFKLQSTALMGLETTINAALRYDPACQQMLLPLAGQVLRVESTLPPMSFSVIHGEKDISLLTNYEGEANTKLRGSALSLLSLMKDKEDRISFYGTGVEVAGDHDQLRQVKRIFQQLDIDWQTALADVVGDIPSQILSAPLSGVSRWHQDASQRASSAATEFVQEEVQLTPTKSEFTEFHQQVRELASQTDRLEKNIINFKKINQTIDLEKNKGRN